MCSSDLSTLHAADGVTNSVPPPAIDKSTPEKALNSYWAYLDWQEQVHDSYLQSAEYRMDKSVRNQVMGGDRLAFQNWSDLAYRQKKFLRTIVKAKSVSDNSTEIIARIQNVTPVAADVNPDLLSRSDKMLFSRKSTGDEIKFVIEKQADGWKVTQALVNNSFDGENGYWTPAYAIPAIPAYTLTVMP